MIFGLLAPPQGTRGRGQKNCAVARSIHVSNSHTKSVFSSPEPKVQGELMVWDSSRRPYVRPSLRPSTLSNMNISETSWAIIIKFHQEHHLGGGLTALGFG